MTKLYLSILFIFTIAYSNGQRCDNKEFCDKSLYGDFDFRSQSNYAQVYSGDTLRVKVVVYSGQDYRIFTCAERKLKKTHFRIIYPEKRFHRTVKSISEKNVPIYEKDKDGNFLYDEKEERIVTGTIFANDTIWGRDLVTSESVVFDSQKEKLPFWEISIHKTRLIIIETIIPEDKKPTMGCIQIMVGRKYKSANPFRR